jgi:hypothetical protein
VIFSKQITDPPLPLPLELPYLQFSSWINPRNTDGQPSSQVYKTLYKLGESANKVQIKNTLLTKKITLKNISCDQLKLYCGLNIYFLNTKTF